MGSIFIACRVGRGYIIVRGGSWFVGSRQPRMALDRTTMRVIWAGVEDVGNYTVCWVGLGWVGLVCPGGGGVGLVWGFIRTRAALPSCILWIHGNLRRLD